MFTAVFCAVYYITGHDVVAALSGKLATILCVSYFIVALRPHQLYYFYNLHISLTELVLLFISLDMLLFIICLWITHHC
jgi:hypothetical protein